MLTSAMPTVMKFATASHQKSLLVQDSFANRNGHVVTCEFESVKPVIRLAWLTLKGVLLRSAPTEAEIGS